MQIYYTICLRPAWLGKRAQHMTTLGPSAKSQIARFPEVTAFVVTDPSGALIEVTGDVDGESVGAVVAVAVRALNTAAESLGIGTLKRASLTGSGFTCLMAATDQELFGIYADPTKPLGPLEKKLEGILAQHR
jgi:predicted regulator of Ras-like GTPase activity (Roadblock/LC7/MglB family)